LPLEEIRVPMTGEVLEIKIKAGDRVQEDDIICILESMKMENPVLTPVTGTIKEVAVSVKQKVNFGDLIAVVEYD